MSSEAATNFFKALFAADDAVLADMSKPEPKDHTERFKLLKVHAFKLYLITDRLFRVYRRTYTQELSKEEVSLVKKRVMEVFKDAKIELPADEEIKQKFEDILEKGKIIS